MGQVKAEISVSLDGYVAGPRPSEREALGVGGEQLHEWAYPLASFQRIHGREGGETGPDDDVLAESFEGVGAVVMGRGMFGGGPGPWGEPAWEGWWGEEPPFRTPVFVLTHHPRDPLVKGSTTFTFAGGAIEAVVAQARAAAGGRDVLVAGGATAIDQALAAGLVDQLDLHLVPVLLGGGRRLFDGLGGRLPRLVPERTIASPRVTHLRCRVER